MKQHSAFVGFVDGSSARELVRRGSLWVKDRMVMIRFIFKDEDEGSSLRMKMKMEQVNLDSSKEVMDMEVTPVRLDVKEVEDTSAYQYQYIGRRSDTRHTILSHPLNQFLHTQNHP